ncbi:MAG: hypothetical protein V3U87_11215 [Methylococcaceae bacterium]
MAVLSTLYAFEKGARRNYALRLVKKAKEMAGSRYFWVSQPKQAAKN